MPLRSGVSVWELLHSQAEVYPQLPNDAACDVLIVGGGISGAIVSVFLARAGLKVILIDREQPLAGSTLACTGLLQYELDVPLTSLRRLLGAVDAERAYQGCWNALKQFPSFAASVGASSAVSAHPSLYLSGNLLAGESMREEAAARRELGIDVAYLTKRELAEFHLHGRDGALCSPTAYGIDPIRLTQACLRAATVYGAQIYGQTELVAHEPGPSNVYASTAHGPVIRARHIVFATGYLAHRLLGFDVGSRSRTYALVTPPDFPNPWPQSALLWEASSPYFYARTIGERICIGGADVAGDDTSEDLLLAKSQELLATLRHLRPELSPGVATAWSGTFISTPDGLPFIGAPDHFRHASFVLGYSGNGILFSFLAGQMVLDRLQGREHPLADLVGFSSVRCGRRPIH